MEINPIFYECKISIKNHYRNVIACIDITLTCNTICNMVAISTCNKYDVKCRKYIKWCEFFADTVNTAKETMEMSKGW